jgi:hypothetical protein
MIVMEGLGHHKNMYRGQRELSHELEQTFQHMVLMRCRLEGSYALLN